MILAVNKMHAAVRAILVASAKTTVVDSNVGVSSKVFAVIAQTVTESSTVNLGRSTAWNLLADDEYQVSPYWKLSTLHQ